MKRRTKLRSLRVNSDFKTKEANFKGIINTKGIITNRAFSDETATTLITSDRIIIEKDRIINSSYPIHRHEAAIKSYADSIKIVHVNSDYTVTETSIVVNSSNVSITIHYGESCLILSSGGYAKFLQTDSSIIVEFIKSSCKVSDYFGDINSLKIGERDIKSGHILKKSFPNIIHTLEAPKGAFLFSIENIGPFPLKINTGTQMFEVSPKSSKLFRSVDGEITV